MTGQCHRQPAVFSRNFGMCRKLVPVSRHLPPEPKHRTLLIKGFSKSIGLAQSLPCPSFTAKSERTKTMSSQRAKRFLLKSYTQKRSIRRRKIIRTTLGELIVAVTDEVRPVIHSRPRLYTVVSWILDDLFARNQIRVHRKSRRKLPDYFTQELVRTN